MVQPINPNPPLPLSVLPVTRESVPLTTKPSLNSYLLCSHRLQYRY